MPAPLAPIAWTALRLGAVAATAYYIKQRSETAPKHVWRERAMDDAEDGVGFTTDRSEGERNAHGAARFRRTIRLGNGPGIEIDLTALGRIRLRRAD